MIRYNVRSRYLVDVINDIRDKKIILAPFFQRKLVWRLAPTSSRVSMVGGSE